MTALFALNFCFLAGFDDKVRVLEETRCTYFDDFRVVIDQQEVISKLHRVTNKPQEVISKPLEVISNALVVINKPLVVTSNVLVVTNKLQLQVVTNSNSMVVMIRGAVDQPISHAVMNSAPTRSNRSSISRHC